MKYKMENTYATHENMIENLGHAVLISAHFHIYQLISAIS